MLFLPFNEEHIDEVFKIAESTLGKRYLSKSYLNKFINSTKHLSFVVVDNDKVIGYTSLILLSPIELKEKVLKENDWFYSMNKNYSTIGLRQQTIVHPDYTKKGLGYKLLDFSSNAVSSLSNVQISTVWAKKSEKSMQSLLLKCNFHYEKTINNYWSEDSLIKNYNCNICGAPPCKCSAEIYIKKNASSIT